MPYMNHIWKVTGFMKTKNGFYSRLELLAKLSMVLMWNINYKISILWEYYVANQCYTAL